MKTEDFESEPLLTPGQAAATLGVDPKTVARWAKAGKIGYIRTLGGHRRFKRAEVLRLAQATTAREAAE